MIAFVIIVLAVILPVYFLVIRPKNDKSGGGGGGGGTTKNPNSPSGATVISLSSHVAIGSDTIICSAWSQRFYGDHRKWHAIHVSKRLWRIL